MSAVENDTPRDEVLQLLAERSRLRDLLHGLWWEFPNSLKANKTRRADDPELDRLLKDIARELNRCEPVKRIPEPLSYGPDYCEAIVKERHHLDWGAGPKIGRRTCRRRWKEVVDGKHLCAKHARMARGEDPDARRANARARAGAEQ